MGTMCRILLVILLFQTGGNVYGQQAPASFRWLEGTWKMTTARGHIVEIWKTMNDTTYHGRSLFVRAPGDSSLQETLQLKKRGAKWSYISTVTGQNSNEPVSFDLIYVGREEFICENPQHDFPQRIAYRKWKDFILANIEGRNNARYSKRNFDYERVR